MQGCAITQINNEHEAPLRFPGGLHDTNREADLLARFILALITYGPLQKCSIKSILMYRVSKIPHIFFQFSQQKTLNVFSVKILQKNKMSHQPPAGPLCEVSTSCWSPFMYVKQLPALGSVNCSQAKHQNAFLIPLKERTITQSCPVGGGVNDRKCIIYIYYWNSNNAFLFFFGISSLQIILHKWKCFHINPDQGQCDHCNLKMKRLRMQGNIY